MKTLLDVVVDAWEAFDQTCLHEGLRRKGNEDSRARALGTRVHLLHDALRALCGDRWQQVQHDVTVLRRERRMHVRDALTAVVGHEHEAAA